MTKTAPSAEPLEVRQTYSVGERTFTSLELAKAYIRLETQKQMVSERLIELGFRPQLQHPPIHGPNIDHSKIREVATFLIRESEHIQALLQQCSDIEEAR